MKTSREQEQGEGNCAGATDFPMFFFKNDLKWSSNTINVEQHDLKKYFTCPRAALTNSATSLRCELRVSIELEESTRLTTVCSDWHAFSTWCFRMTHELFPWMGAKLRAIQINNSLDDHAILFLRMPLAT